MTRIVSSGSALSASSRSTWRWRAPVLAVVTALTAMGGVVAGSSPAGAATSQFRGMNWAVLGDNFVKGPLVVQGLSTSDSNATVRAKANALYDDMASTMGVNTVRLPVNTHTVGTTWWNAYRGAIDAATERGFKVILAYWEDGAASGGRITNLAAWNTMWSRVTSTYGSNPNVYFEPMNEPHGYSSAEWRNVAAEWLRYHYSAVPSRVLIGGTGFSQDLRDICNDSRFNSTLLSFHYYTFFVGAMTYDAFRSHIQTLLGNCASRAVTTEFGAPMNDGRNYADANSTDNFVRYVRAVAQVMRDNQMGGTYWPAVGGKTGSIGYDWYSMFALSGSGTNLNLAIRNASGADRVRYAWGDTPGGVTTTTTTRPTTTTTTTTRPTTSTTTPVTTTTTTTRPTTSTTTPVTTTSGPGTGGGCTAAFRAVGAWSTGYQGEVAVSGSGTGWTVTLTLPAGVTITQVWGGIATTSGSVVTVRNESWNANLSAGATFGYLANGPATAPAVTCAA